MTRELASAILKRLQVYYPKTFSSNWNYEQCKIFVDDLIEAFEPYKEECVVRAYKEWHENNAFVPTTADILNALKTDLARNRKEPLREKQYEIYIGADGNEYAREIK